MRIVIGVLIVDTIDDWGGFVQNRLVAGSDGLSPDDAVAVCAVKTIAYLTAGQPEVVHTGLTVYQCALAFTAYQRFGISIATV